VNHDGHAVASQTHIQLDAVRAVVKCSSEGRQSIFRRQSGRPAMTDDER
jgi:hypothetical protein